MLAGVKQEPSRLGVMAAFASVYIIWGSTYLAIRYALETMPPLLMAGVRHLLAGVILYAVLRFSGTPRPQRIHWRSAAVIGALLLLVGNGGVCWAEQTIPSGLAALFVTTVPVWMVLLNWVRRDGVRPSGTEVAGVAMGFVGVAVLIDTDSLGGAAVDRMGAAILIGASLAWALGSIYSRHASLPQSPLMATAMQMLCGGVFLSIVSLMLGEGAKFELAKVSMRSALSLLYLTLFGSLVAFSAYVWLLRVSTPAKVSTYAFVNPMVAVALGSLFADEPLTPRTMIAAAVIVVAVVLITRQRIIKTATPVQGEARPKAVHPTVGPKPSELPCDLKTIAAACTE